MSMWCPSPHLLAPNASRSTPPPPCAPNHAPPPAPCCLLLQHYTPCHVGQGCFGMPDQSWLTHWQARQLSCWHGNMCQCLGLAVRSMSHSSRKGWWREIFRLTRMSCLLCLEPPAVWMPAKPDPHERAPNWGHISCTTISSTCSVRFELVLSVSIAMPSASTS